MSNEQWKDLLFNIFYVWMPGYRFYQFNTRVYVSVKHKETDDSQTRRIRILYLEFMKNQPS